jgi:hypothetical protein
MNAKNRDRNRNANVNPNERRNGSRNVHFHLQKTWVIAAIVVAANQANAIDSSQRATSVAPIGKAATPMIQRNDNVTMKAPTATLAIGAAAITGIDNAARGVAAGETIIVRGRGFGGTPGSAKVLIKSGHNDARSELAIRISHWQDDYVSGTVASSHGIKDGRAALTLSPPAGASINTAQVGGGAASKMNGGYDYKFVASRANVSLNPSGLGNALSASYAAPTPHLIIGGSSGKLVNDAAVARRLQAGVLACNEATAHDRFKVKLSEGFDLINVKLRDLNASKRYGLAAPEACDIRSTIPATDPLRWGADGSIVVGATWDTVNRYGSRSQIRGCDSSRYLGVTKTPLGFDWDNTATDRCAANAEYIIDQITVRGPAGVDPLSGASNAVIR